MRLLELDFDLEPDDEDEDFELLLLELPLLFLLELLLLFLLELLPELLPRLVGRALRGTSFFAALDVLLLLLSLLLLLLDLLLLVGLLLLLLDLLLVLLDLLLLLLGLLLVRELLLFPLSCSPRFRFIAEGDSFFSSFFLALDFLVLDERELGFELLVDGRDVDFEEELGLFLALDEAPLRPLLFATIFFLPPDDDRDALDFFDELLLLLLLLLELGDRCLPHRQGSYPQELQRDEARNEKNGTTGAGAWET